MLAQFMYMEHNMKIKVKIYNVETAEETMIEREETAQEKQERIDCENALVLRQAEADAKTAQRQALLSRLGITEEEARILLGGN